MHVVLRAVYIYGGAFQLPDNHAHVTEHVVSTVLAEVRYSIFGAENNVAEKAGVEVWPMPLSPSGRQDLRSGHVVAWNLSPLKGLIILDDLNPRPLAVASDLTPLRG